MWSGENRYASNICRPYFVQASDTNAELYYGGLGYHGENNHIFPATCCAYCTGCLGFTDQS